MRKVSKLSKVFSAVCRRDSTNNFSQQDISRVSRITNEFAEGFRGLSRTKKPIVFFGSRNTQECSLYYELARKIAYSLSKKGYTIVTGAGSGIMEAANRGANEAGGKSVGLNILVPKKQIPNRSEEHTSELQSH